MREGRWKGNGGKVGPVMCVLNCGYVQFIVLINIHSDTTFVNFNFILIFTKYFMFRGMLLVTQAFTERLLGKTMGKKKIRHILWFHKIFGKNFFF